MSLTLVSGLRDWKWSAAVKKKIETWHSHSNQVAGNEKIMSEVQRMAIYLCLVNKTVNIVLVIKQQQFWVFQIEGI